MFVPGAPNGSGEQQREDREERNTEVYVPQNKASANKMVSISAFLWYVLKRSFIAQARRMLALASLHAT